MWLSNMITADEDALICDMAETYGILDMYKLPVTTLAILACGLRADSRIMLKMRGQSIDDNTLLLASAVDRLSFLAWAKTEDARHGRNRPASIVMTMLEPKEKENNIVGYENGDDLLKHMDMLREEARKNARYRKSICADHPESGGDK